MPLSNAEVVSYWESRWRELAAGDAFRARAFDHFRKAGWPSAGSATWTDLSPDLLRSEWKISRERDKDKKASSTETEPLTLPRKAAFAVAVNGVLEESRSDLDGWELLPAEAKDFGWRDGIDALYQAFHRGRIGLRAGKSARPLVIVHLQAERQAFNPLLLRVDVPAGVETGVFECWLGQSQAWTGTLTEVRLERGAKLEWIRWQNKLSRHLSPQKFILARDSRLDWFGVQSNSDWIRSVCDVEMQEDNAEANLYGLSFSGGRAEADTKVSVSHLAPHTRSSQKFKTVLREQAKSVFAGKIIIAPAAQKSDARQRHQSLNFDASAEAISRPELEIEADDVKASHGATVGRLNQDELFYLETRGIPRQKAMELLARAFVEDILNHISNNAFHHFIDDRLNGEIADFLQEMERS